MVDRTFHNSATGLTWVCDPPQAVENAYPAAVYEVTLPKPGNGNTWNHGTQTWVVNPDFVAVTPAMVRAHAESLIMALGPDYTDAEKQTWAAQSAEAYAHQQDSGVSVPLLTGIADGRGITVEQLAGYVRARVEFFSQASGIILGKQAALLAQDPIPENYTHPSHWS